MRHKNNKSFRKVITEPTISEHFDYIMQQCNDYCLKHCSQDLTMMEFEMEKTLFNWFNTLFKGPSPTHEDIVMYSKWAEVVSRWNPLFNGSDELLRKILKDRTMFEDGYLRHCDELPDELA